MESLVKIDDSSIEVRDVFGDKNEVYMTKININSNAVIMLNRIIEDSAPLKKKSLAVEGSEDGFVLHKPLKALENELKESEVKEMIEILCRACKTNTPPDSAADLFTCLMQLGKLHLRDFTFLQCLLWSVGRQDLFKEVASTALTLQERFQEDDPKFRISHLDAPHLKPVDGFKYVRFHLKVDLMEMSSKRLADLERHLARILDVPQKYVVVVGVEPDHSAWVTVAMPTAACLALDKNYYLPDLQNVLASLDIDKVGFIQEPAEARSSRSLAAMSCAQAERFPFANPSRPIVCKEGMTADEDVNVTFHLHDNASAEPCTLLMCRNVPVGFLKGEMDEVWDLPATQQLWLYQGQELDDSLELASVIADDVSHIDVVVKASPDVD